MLELAFYIVLLVGGGFVWGVAYLYRKERKQCLNCGSHKTYMEALTSGNGGGEYEYAVRHTEYYRCKSCGTMFSAKFKINK